MQNAMIPGLLIQFPFFFADTFQVIDRRLQCRRKKQTQVLKHRLRAVAIRQRHTPGAALSEIGQHFAMKEFSEFDAGALVHLQTGSNR